MKICYIVFVTPYTHYVIMKSYLDIQNYRDLTVYECGREECVKNKAISLTVKRYCLFHYVVSGKGTLILNNKEYKLQKGMIFYIPRESDAIYFPDRESPWTYEWIGFDGVKIDELLSHMDINGLNPIYEDKFKKYRKHFDDIVSRYINTGALDLFTIGSMYQLLSEMISDFDGEVNVSHSKITIKLAKDFIENNYQFDINVNDVARNANVTPNYLSAIFNKEEGMSTKAYLIKVRMEKALDFLKSNRFNIKEISEMVGYQSQLYFSNEFKRYYGKSPSIYLGEEE